MSNLFEETPQEGMENNQANAPAEAASTQPEEQKAETNVQSDPYADLLNGIRTQDGRQKYADVATALGSIPHAQSRIDELSGEVAKLQEELQKRQGMEDMIEHMKSSSSAPESPSVSSGLDEQAVTSILQQQLAQMEQAKAREANAATVRQAFEGKYGEKANDVFKSKAAELGVTEAQFTELAFTAPKLVMSHFDGMKAKDPQPLGGQGINTSTIKPSAPEYKAVMRGASIKDVVEQFKAHKPQ